MRRPVGFRGPAEMLHDFAGECVTLRSPQVKRVFLCVSVALVGDLELRHGVRSPAPA